MNFKELTINEQEHYIISNFMLAVKISKALPRIGPKNSLGIYANVSDRSVWDGWYEGIDRRIYTQEQWTIFENVLFYWRNAFVKNKMISPIWKRLWIIFDDTYSIKQKERKLGIKKTYIYSNRDQGIEIIRQYLLRKGK